MQRGASRAVVDLERLGESRQSRTDAGQRAQRGEQRARHRKETRFAPQSGGERADQVRGREILVVAHEQGHARRRRVGRGDGQQVGEIVAEDEAAAVVDRGERQRQSTAGKPHQRRKIGPDAGTIDERWPDDRQLDAGVSRAAAAAAPARSPASLAPAVGILGAGAIVGGQNGCPGRCCLAHRLDRTDEHQPPAAGSGEAAGQRGDGFGLGGERRRVRPGMGALGEMDHRLDPSQRRGPISPWADFAEHHRCRTRRRLRRATQPGDDIVAARGERRTQRGADKPAGPGDEDARHAVSPPWPGHLNPLGRA